MKQIIKTHIENDYKIIEYDDGTIVKDFISEEFENNSNDFLENNENQITNNDILEKLHQLEQIQINSFLTTEYLAAIGFFVVSIQHELSTDSLLPLKGNPQIVRRPFWERGADNILFVINELKRTNPDLAFNHISLIGHSNGGDMTALFPEKYPNIVEKIITLDNRRKALPKSKEVKVYSLRSSDQPADEGVIPTVKETKKYKMKIVKLANTTHNEMDNNANDEQRREIQEYILTFIND